MDRKNLLEGLSEDIYTYVMHGVIPESVVTKNIKPEDLDERFENFRLLMDLHFILKEDVVEFVELLSDRLREIKTQTKNRKRTYRGTTEGRIDWQSTLNKRYSENPDDPSLFVCEKRTEHYDIDENIVLKKLLSIIYHTLQDAEEIIKEDYEWLRKSWKDNEDLIDRLKNIFERNVHVIRIKEPSEYEPTDRMVFTALNSRKEVYREAGRLIRVRKRIQKGDEEEIEELLEDTAITPDDDETLFELFVLFKYISAIEDIYEDEFEVYTMKPRKGSEKEEVARISGEKDIILYHNSSAGDEGLSFKDPEIDDEDDEDLSRADIVQKKAYDTTIDYFIDDEGITNYTGRPDVIILEIKDEEEDEYGYLITEVKCSSKRDTIRRGIKETFEYLAFLRLEDENDFEFDDDLGDGWNGVLVIQDLEDEETKDFEEQEDMGIKILQASEIEDGFERILEEVIFPERA